MRRGHGLGWGRGGHAQPLAALGLHRAGGHPRRFVLPLRAVLGPGVTDTPVVDVTPRRVQRFRCLPGERIRWSFGTARGTVTAASDGSVTVPRLRLGGDWLPLVLERERG